MGKRLPCKQGVAGSSPAASTTTTAHLEHRQLARFISWRYGVQFPGAQPFHAGLAERFRQQPSKLFTRVRLPESAPSEPPCPPQRWAFAGGASRRFFYSIPLAGRASLLSSLIRPGLRVGAFFDRLPI